MNMPNFILVRNRIAAPSAHINMSHWAIDEDGWSPSSAVDVSDMLTKCGTAGCMAGYALTQCPRIVIPSVVTQAAEFLGLNTEESDFVFYGVWHTKLLGHLTKEGVLEYMDAVIATGNIYIRKGLDY